MHRSVCARLAERHGLTVIERFSDAAISGGTAERPGHQALLPAARRHEFDVIVAEDTSRLWRNLAEQAPRLAELSVAKIEAHAANSAAVALSTAHSPTGALTVRMCPDSNRSQKRVELSLVPRLSAVRQQEAISMLHPNYLTELIEIGGRALEQEDRFIAGCVTTNPHLYADRNQPGGLLRFRDERYYQFIIRRALMSGYRYRVDTEEATHDFVLRETVGGEWLAVGEMKKWMAAGNEAELPGMRKDIAKLRDTLRKDGVSGFFIVAAAWPPHDAGRQLEVLKSGLELTAAPALYRFHTIGWPEDREREFALVGFDVR